MSEPDNCENSTNTSIDANQSIDANMLRSLLELDDALRSGKAKSTIEFLDSSVSTGQLQGLRELPGWESAAACLIELENFFPRRKTSHGLEIPETSGIVG